MRLATGRGACKTPLKALETDELVKGNYLHWVVALFGLRLRILAESETTVSDLSHAVDYAAVLGLVSQEK